MPRDQLVILMADDDEDDCLLAKEALKDARLSNELLFVSNGEELMDYLKQRGNYALSGSAPKPGIILLDLNMPKKDGREALAEIKADVDLRSIPVVVMTTSKSEEDVERVYHLGANSYITKPVTFDGLVDAMRALNRYWFEIVKLPKAA